MICIWIHLIQGLFMEGARWNRSTMSIDEPLNGQLHDCMPLILCHPIDKRSEMQRCDVQLYEAPVYCTPSRHSVPTKSGHSTNLVTFLNLKTHKHPTHWMFRGVALLCQLYD